jgi:hypothetical protein
LVKAGIFAAAQAFAGSRRLGAVDRQFGAAPRQRERS